MFNKHFKIVEIRKSGAVITHYLKGKKAEVNKDIEAFKGIATKYEMMKKKKRNGHLGWVNPFDYFLFKLD